MAKQFIDSMPNKSLFGRLFGHSSKQETVQSRAEGGNADAQFSLGVHCASNKETADYPLAIEWYLKAAEQNHVLAQFNLGVMYANGQGVLPSEHEAEIWFDRAARQQDPGAQHYLGMSHYRASFKGTPRQVHESRIEAYKWFALAAALGYQNSDSTRDQIALKMSHEDLAEAALRIDKFLLSNRAKALAHKTA